jgi:hypothetical protein
MDFYLTTSASTFPRIKDHMGKGVTKGNPRVSKGGTTGNFQENSKSAPTHTLLKGGGGGGQGYFRDL